jgi:FkbM family methyltransferase
VGPTDHAEVALSSGTVGRLRARLTHYTCESYSQYLPKLSRYADVQARIWRAAGRQASFLQLLLRFPLRFLQGYVWRLGFLDGLAGLQVCVLVAYLSWLKQAYLWQLQSGRSWSELENNEVTLLVTGRESTAGQASSGTQGAPNYEQLESTGRASGTHQDGRKLSLREVRRRWTPRWLRTDVRRRWRNVLFRRMGIQRCYTPPIFSREPSLVVRSSLPFVVANELVRNPRMTFMQIGAFDGVGEDDLRELVVTHQLRGVLVEPQPSAFARLQQTYRGQPQVTLLRAAISEQEGVREFYSTRDEATMAASFDRGHLRKHGIPESKIVAEQVACHTVESALRAAGLQHVDLLQIDAEGYDWPIIRSIDFSRLRPRILRFEYRHMAGDDADECISLLAGHGYRFVIEERDIIAILAADSLSASRVPKRQSA